MLNKINNIDSEKVKSTLLLCAYVVLLTLFAIFFNRYVDRNTLQSVVNNSGAFGIVSYFFIEVFYVTFTPLLNTVVLITSGYIFGGHVGFIINFLATSTGLLLIVLLVKKYGRPVLEKVLPKKTYAKFDSIVQRVGPVTLLVCYVLPFTPDDELTYVIAAGPISIKRFILPILLGTLAKSAYSYIGDIGARGVLIATYARVGMLVVGLVLVGGQEYLFKKRYARANDIKL